MSTVTARRPALALALPLQLAALFMLLFANFACAHENRPLYVDITEQQQQTYWVQMKVPPTVALNNQPKVSMPDTCTLVAVSQYRCDKELSGQFVTIAFELYNPSVSTFVRLTRMNGEIYSDMLTAEEDQWQVPDKETAIGVARHYTWLGVEHILIGLDHLLFLACLLFIAQTFKRVIITITGFTVAHSITLVAAALQWVELPIAPVETLIAFSILFLAVEIARREIYRAPNTLTYEYPVLVSSSFGLLHGFGFASVLRDIGLPQTEVVTGLLFFNIGVELGQIFFTLICVAVVYTLVAILGRQSRALAAMPVVAIYSIGSLSAFWLFDRGLSVFA